MSRDFVTAENSEVANYWSILQGGA